MKKNFDLHRLSMVLRWDILTNWQRHLGATAGLAICKRQEGKQETQMNLELLFNAVLMEN